MHTCTAPYKSHSSLARALLSAPAAGISTFPPELYFPELSSCVLARGA